MRSDWRLLLLEDELRGRYLSNNGFMWAVVSGRVLLRKEQASSSARTVRNCQLRFA